MPIPIEAGCFPYTPECFSGLEGAPTFTLRHGTRRDRHAYQDEVRLRQLRSYSTQDIRDAIIEEVQTKWASDAMPVGEVVDAVQRYFSAADELDAGITAWRKATIEAMDALPEGQDADEAFLASLPPAPELDFDPVEREKVENLIDDVTAHSQRIGRMQRDNGKREREIRRIALAVLLEGTSLPVPVKRNLDGLVDEAAIYAIEDALDEFSDAEEHRGGIAFSQLGTKALLSFFLTKEEEKNSSSPVATPSGANSSKASDYADSITETSASKEPDGDHTPAKSSQSKTSA